MKRTSVIGLLCLLISAFARESSASAQSCADLACVRSWFLASSAGLGETAPAAPVLEGFLAMMLKGDFAFFKDEGRSPDKYQIVDSVGLKSLSAKEGALELTVEFNIVGTAVLSPKGEDYRRSDLPKPTLQEVRYRAIRYDSKWVIEEIPHPYPFVFKR